MSEDYWKGYDDQRRGAYCADGFLHNSTEKEDYIKGYDDSEYDSNNGHDAR